MNLAKTALSVFTLRIISTVLQALGLVYFAQALGASRLGVFVLFQAVLTLLRFGANSGVNRALEKRVSEGNGPAVVGSTLLIKGGLVALVAVVLFPMQGFLNQYIGAPITPLLLVVLIPQQLGLVTLITLRGELRVQEATVLNLTKNIVFIGCGSLLLFFDFGVRGLIAGLAISWVVTAIWGGIKITTNVGLPTKGAIRSLFSYSKYNIVASVIGGYMYNWLDTVFIGIFLTQSHVAAYEVAWRIAGIVMLLSRSIASTIFPQISDWDTSDEREKILDLLPNAVTGSLLLVFPAVVGGALFRTEILRYLFGSEFVLASTVLVVLLIAKIPEGVNTIFGQMLMGIDRPDLVARAVAAFIGLNAVLNLVLISQFGLLGAAVATGVSFAVNAGLTAYYLNAVMRIRLNWRDLGTSVIAALGMGACLLVVRMFVRVNSIIPLLALIGAGGLVYLSLLFMSSDFRRRVVHVTQNVL